MWFKLALLSLTFFVGCASPPGQQPESLPSDSDAFLRSLVGPWSARWRQDELVVEAVEEHGRVTFRRVSPRNPNLSILHQAPDTLIQFWISNQTGRVVQFDPNFAHALEDELCLDRPGMWQPCASPDVEWRFQFVTPDLIQIGEPDSPRAELRRLSPGRVF